MKKTFSILITVSMILMSIAGMFSVTYAATGSIDNPYIIKSAEQISGLSASANASGLYYKIANDITISGTWTPRVFYGNLIGSVKEDGKNCVITFDNVSISSDYTGLFSQLYGSVSGIDFEGNLTGTKNVGSVAGRLMSGSKIENCTSFVNVQGSQDGVGGFAGYSVGGTINNCIKYGTVNMTGVIRYIGGFVGNASSNAVVTNCVNYGEVSGYERNGGIVGYTSDATVTVSRCANYGTVNSSSSGAGGIVGYSQSNISNCLNDGQISASSFVGGITYYANANVVVENCINTAKLSSTGNVTSGIVAQGVGTTTVKNCFNSGEMNSTNNTYRYPIGGYKGYTITNSYYTTPLKAYTTIVSGVSEIKDSTFATMKENNTLPDGFSDEIWGYYPDSAYELPQLIGIPVKNATYDLPEPPEPPKEDFTNYNGGTGGADDPYKISDATHFSNISLNPSAYFILENDILLTTPVDEFSGNFNGNNKTVTLNIDEQQDIDNVGMFRVLTGSAVIKNFTINGSVKGKKSNVGSVAGFVTNSTANSSLSGILNHASVSGLAYVGGIVGFVTTGQNAGLVSISECKNTGNIYSVSNYAGGISGVSNCSITKCANVGAVTSSLAAGGISGYTYGPISYCYNIGSVASSIDAGGIVGEVRLSTASLTSCYNLGTIAGKDAAAFGSSTTHTGSVVTAINCYNVGAIIREDGQSPLVVQASNIETPNLTNCYYLNGTNNQATKINSLDDLKDLTIEGYQKGTKFPILTNNVQTEDVDFTTITVSSKKEGDLPTVGISYILNNTNFVMPLCPEEDYMGSCRINSGDEITFKSVLFADVSVNDETTVNIVYSLYNHIKVSFEENLFSVELISEDGNYNGKVVIALFDADNRLIELKLDDACSNLEISLSKVSEASYAKVMWWDDFLTLSPSCKYNYVQIAEQDQ